MESDSNIVGIVYSKDTADNSFGSVLESSEIETSRLISVLSSAGAYIMFYLRDGVLIIADAKRNPLYPQDSEVSGDMVFNYFSSSKVNELRELGGAQETFIELRREVLTLSNGNFTLENSRPCPPYCP